MVSILNGLSALGTGVAQFAGAAGLEQQKADLAQQQVQLADQLATTRESAGRQEAGQIAATAADKQQTFTAGQGQLNRDAEMARAKASEDAAMARTQVTISAPPEQIKLLRALGVPLPGNASSAPAASSGDTPPASDGSAAPAGTTALATPDLTTNPLVAKALGMPMAGSEDAIRRAIATDVSADPAFKGKTVGQKAAEVESRLAVAGGKIADPSSRESMAQAIANYQAAPLTNFALTKAGGPETMARVFQLNPDYQEARYPEVAKGMASFGSGPEGDKVRVLNTGVQHIATLGDAADAMNNNPNMTLPNAIMNPIKTAFGVDAPNTFDGLKQIVATEIEKAVAGGIGAAEDRNRLMASLKSSNTPEMLHKMLDGFQSLMAGQLKGLKKQYEDTTGFKNGPFAFENKLVPETLTALGLRPKDAPPALAPADPTAREVGKSYPLPNGQNGIWRGTGWEVSP